MECQYTQAAATSNLRLRLKLEDEQRRPPSQAVLVPSSVAACRRGSESSGLGHEAGWCSVWTRIMLRLPLLPASMPRDCYTATGGPTGILPVMRLA